MQIEWFTVGSMALALSCTVYCKENMNSVEICTYVVALFCHMVMEPIVPGCAAKDS